MNVVFWNVDTQRDFMIPGGRLYVKGAEEIVGKLKELTEFAKEHRIEVVNTADYHTTDTKEISETPDFKTTFPAHAIAGDLGQDFISQTDPREFSGNYYIIQRDQPIDLWKFRMSRNIILFKDAFDVFDPVNGNKNIEEVLKILKPDLIVTYGVSGDYCVDYAIKGLLDRKYNVIAVYDAIKSIGATPFEEWIRLGAMVMSTNTVKHIMQTILK